MKDVVEIALDEIKGTSCETDAIELIESYIHWLERIIHWKEFLGQYYLGYTSEELRKDFSMGKE